MSFTLTHTDVHSGARAGVLQLTHGVVHTPIFMPVGTLGTVKAVHQRELVGDVQAQLILGNTYHLYLRPGMEVIAQAGGLHRFMGWHKPILTDSGGYQVFSLARQRKITEEGVAFRSHISGASCMLTPESAIDIQRTIGADIMMAFDECTPSPCSYLYAKQSMERTHRWLARCQQRFEATAHLTPYAQLLFPIVQGSTYADLRERAVETVVATNPPGVGIGGVCHPTGDLYRVTEMVCGWLPQDRPRYLMGVGTPQDLLTCIGLGVDMFDCVLPARNGRHGVLYTTQGVVRVKNRKWKNDFSPLDAELGGYVSTHHTKAYLHHLIHAHEHLGAQIATLHNLRFFLWLVQKARQHIVVGTFNSWKERILKRVTAAL